MEIKAREFLINNICKYQTKTVDLRQYSCDYINGKFNLRDYSEYKCVNKRELLDYDLAPADIPLVKNLMEVENG